MTPRSRVYRVAGLTVAGESPSLSFTVADEGDGVLVLSLGGQLDFVSAPELAPRLADLQAATCDAVVVDVSGVTFIDSTGLNALVAGAQSIQSRDAAVLVAGASKHVARVFEIVRLGETLRLESTLEDAVRAARTGRGAGG